MRFILIHRFGVLQTKTERIDVNFCEGTTQLLQYLQKRANRSARQFIVRIKRGRVSYRVVGGWPLSTYSLKEGSELHIEIIEASAAQQPNINARYLHTLFGARHGMMESIEEKEAEAQEEEGGRQFSVRGYLDSECERMLKMIQKGNHKGFLEIFQELPVQADEEQVIEIHSKKPLLVDQLGEKGWGALHYSIFYKAVEIFDQLLQMEADVNKCTSDGWLPIQLSTNIKQLYCVDRLLAHPSISLNLISSRGSALHVAAREANPQILRRLLERDVDLTLKDNAGKTVFDVCTDQHCLAILKKYQEKKQSYLTYVKGGSPLATVIRGKVLKAKRPFMQLKERFLFIDPFQGLLFRYAAEEDYPKKPIEMTPLSSVQGIKIIMEEDKSWYMKGDLHYFQIERPNKEIYACRYESTVQKWMTSIKAASKFAQELEKNPQIISEVKRNEIVIEDKIIQAESPKKNKKNVFDLTHRSRGERGEQTPQITPHPPNDMIHSNNKALPQPFSNLQESQGQLSPSKESEGRRGQQTLTKELNKLISAKISFASFSIIETLGVGAFGKVFLARLISSGKLYALKALKKKNLIMQKQLKYAIVQANILKSANHPFIINMHFAFQTPHYLYLALDYCPGRDLSFHLAREVTFPEDEARYYIGQLCLALQHLHSKDIIYRDLKPENVLLDARGDVRLTDFGLSKQTTDERTKSFCGSPAYLSPEMLAQRGAGKACDLYGLGAMLYEFLVGQPPYFSDDIPTLYQNIKEAKLKFPKGVSECAKSLIAGLLERDPKRRYGWEQVRNHAFFGGFDWDGLGQLKLMPPVRPEVEKDQEEEEGNVVLKQRNEFSDFDYEDSTKKINRLMNFSFVRKEIQ